jgi:hypothetical protein
MELNEENYASTHHESKFYHIVLRSKKKGEDQDAAHLIPDVQEVSTSILPKYIVTK